MVVDTFEMQKQYLSSSMAMFDLILQLVINKGKWRFHVRLGLSFGLIAGNPVSIEALDDRDDVRAVHCFPSEIYAGRSANNPYQSLRNRSCHSKQSARPPRLDAYDYKKLSVYDEEKPSGFSNLRRKSLSSCDLFHVTSKTLSSPFDEIHNWLNNKRKSHRRRWLRQESVSSLDTTASSQEKMTSDEFELIQLALVHLTSSNRQFLYVILYFLTQCVKNTHFCPTDTIRLRVSTHCLSLPLNTALPSLDPT